MDNTNIPEYLLPYTKNSYEQWCKERELAIVKRASEVGKLKCCEETGWSNTIVNDACNRHGVEVRPRGRPKKIHSTQQKTGDCESHQHKGNNPDTTCSNKSGAGEKLGEMSGQTGLDPGQVKNGPENFVTQDPAQSPEIRCESVQFQTLKLVVDGFNYDNPDYYQPPKNPWKNNVKHRPLPEGCTVWQPDELPPGSSKILLTRNLFAIVDSDMVDVLSRFSWSANPDYTNVYATSCDVNKKNMRMHRYVLGLAHGQKAIVDHINNCGLDNRRCNLRVVTNSENQLNRAETVKVKSRFKGVCKGNVKGWTTYIKIDGKQTKKNFDTEEEAARYYDELVRKHRGPDAQTNESLGLFENFGDSE